jgi:hypothetical protein
LPDSNAGLEGFVRKGVINGSESQELIDPIMHGNARIIFNLAEKQKALAAL